jgi:hypothetical protein
MTTAMIPVRIVCFVLILSAIAGAEVHAVENESPNALRVVGSGNSFSGGSVSTFDEIVRLAGIKSATRVIYSGIGGSRVIQHWDLPDDKNVAKKALLEGNVDVMTMNPIFMPDEGIAKFVKFGLEHNPKMRFAIQQSWLIYDQRGTPETEVLYAKRSYNKKFDPNTRTSVDEIRREHEPVFKALEDHVRELNKQVGHDAVTIIPIGRAAILLREKIIARQAPGLDSQNALFDARNGVRDEMCHPSGILTTLGGYCYYASIYQRSPVGLPVPSNLAKTKLPDVEKLNRLLQDLAWQAVTEHPLSGVKARQ